VFEQKLRAAQIPYKVSGGQSFFDRAEIKDLCAWLRLLVNQDDDPAFLRAVTTPKRGIGHQTLAALGEFAGKWKLSLFEALFSPSLGTALKGKASARCTSSAATSTTWSTAPATPPGPRTPRRCCWAG
jgi:ATP-dependent DNA helicase Rep